MKIIIASDHAGFSYKSILIDFLQSKGHLIIDKGGNGQDPLDDYPLFAEKVARAIIEKKGERGILICGSSVGVSVAANKFKGIRAAVCTDCYSAHQSVEHDHANILCLGQRIIGIEVAKEIVLAFINSVPSFEARHIRRVQEISDIEQKNFK